jgi:PAS domain S-box-containing protein
VISEGAQPDPSALGRLARVLREESLESALTEGAALVAHLAACPLAAIFIADGSGPLRESWHAENPGERERLRAAFKTLALEAVRTGTAARGTADSWGAYSTEALPLVAQGRTIGAVCLARLGDPQSPPPESEHALTALISMLAWKTFGHEELARHRAQRARDERWFKTLDGHLRVLDRERQKFAAFVNQTDTLVYVTDESRTLRWNNRAMADLFPPEGSDASWIGKRCEDVCARLGKPCERCPIQEACERHAVAHREIRADVDGNPGILYLTAIPIMAPNGPADEIMVMIQDLTGLEGLRRSESRYRLLYERNVDAIVMVEPETHGIVLANPAASEMLGYSEAELLARKLSDLHPTECWDVLRERYAEGLRSESRVGPECVVRTSSGEERLAEITATRLSLEGKDVLLVHLRDITEQRRAEGMLRDSERRKGAILDTALDCILTIDHLGCVTEFNRAAERTFGYLRENVLGCDLADLVTPPSLREAHREGLRRLLGTGASTVLGRRIETVAMRSDGSEFPVELAVTRVEGIDPPSFTGYIRDLTERRAAEEALRRSEEQLRQSQKMEAVGVLAGGVAHDFNNLLTVIMTQSELLLKELSASNPSRPKAEAIHAASARGSLLTRQLLTFSRNEVCAPENVDLNAIVRDGEELLRRLLGEDVELACVLSQDPARVRADRGHLEQVILNLAVNARDAMPDGGGLRIEVSHARLDEMQAGALSTIGPGPYCVLTVTDTGVGMDLDIQRRIFEPFFTTKERGKGTGLGLSTVYGIVKQGGGSVTVSSEPGRGAVFCVYLPQAPEPASASAREPRMGSLCQGTETILLVEDEPAVRAIGRELLEINGYRILEAEHGIQALEIASSFQGTIDLLLSDVVMPRMSGRELAERMMVLRPGIRVLLVSGFADDRVMRNGVLDSGMAFLQKPFTLESLSQRVRDVLDAPATPKV